MTVSKEEYQKNFALSDYSFLQSWEWGEIKKGDWKVERMIVDSVPVTMLLKKIPIQNKYFGYIPRGFSASNLSGEFLTKVISQAKELGLAHLIVEPNIEFSNIEDRKFIDVGFQNTGKTIQPNYSNVVDLSQTEEEILEKMETNYRRLVKRSQKRGYKVGFHTGGEEPLNEFFSVLKSIEKNTKHIIRDFEYYRTIWQFSDGGKFCKIVTIKDEVELLGALFVVYSKDFGYQLYGGVNEKGRAERAAYLMYFESFLEAKRNGKKFYDQWGVAKFGENGFEKRDAMFGISNFKHGFGGKDIAYLPQYTYVFDRLGYSIFRLGESVLKLILALKKLVRK